MSTPCSFCTALVDSERAMLPVSSCVQGVRIREREVQHIWMSPEAPWVREGVASGVPLRATLEGPGADRFSLDVTNAAGSNKAPGGPSEQRQGKAKGVRASVRSRGFRAGRRGESSQGRLMGSKQRARYS